jgi:2,3-bisphosphoglycerate-independent phosphoglycerate mutase
MGPVVLAILDGWGITSEKKGNAILAAKTPNYDLLKSKYLFTQVQASGQYVGLPQGLMGNSEVGHLTIGSGRIVTQKADIDLQHRCRRHFLSQSGPSGSS